MIRRNTWVLLGIFIVALGLVWAIPWWQSTHPQPTPTPGSASQPLFGSPAPQISEVTISAADGKELTLKSSGNDQWTAISKPGTPEVSADKIGSAVSDFQGILISAQLTTPPPMDVIGLSTPSNTITVKFVDGAIKVIKVGSVTPTSSGYYIQVDDDHPVVVGKYTLDSLLALLTPAPSGTETPTVSATATISGTPQPTGAPIEVFPTTTP